MIYGRKFCEPEVARWLAGRRQIAATSHKEQHRVPATSPPSVYRSSDCNNYRTVVIVYPDDRNTVPRRCTAFPLAVNLSRPVTVLRHTRAGCETIQMIPLALARAHRVSVNFNRNLLATAFRADALDFHTSDAVKQ